MGWSLLSHTILGSTTGNGVTTGAIDTTGADLIVIGIVYAANTSSPTITDSQGNTWTALTPHGNNDIENSQLLYCHSPTVGASHTFAETGTSTYCTLSVLAFSGSAASPFDVEAGNVNTSGSTSLTAGTVTPTQDNELVVSVVQVNGSSTSRSCTTTGFATPESLDQIGGQHYASAIAWAALGPGTSGIGVTPSWSWTTTSVNSDASTGTFKMAAAALSTLKAYIWR